MAGGASVTGGSVVDGAEVALGADEVDVVVDGRGRPDDEDDDDDDEDEDDDAEVGSRMLRPERGRSGSGKSTTGKSAWAASMYAPQIPAGVEPPVMPEPETRMEKRPCGEPTHTAVDSCMV